MSADYILLLHRQQGWQWQFHNTTLNVVPPPSASDTTTGLETTTTGCAIGATAAGDPTTSSAGVTGGATALGIGTTPSPDIAAAATAAAARGAKAAP